MELPKLAAYQRGRFYFKCAASASAIAFMAAVLHQSFSKLGVGMPARIHQPSQLSDTPATPGANALQKTQLEAEPLQDLQPEESPAVNDAPENPAIKTESATGSTGRATVAVEYAAVQAEVVPAAAIGLDSTANKLQALPSEMPDYSSHSENF